MIGKPKTLKKKTTYGLFKHIIGQKTSRNRYNAHKRYFELKNQHLAGFRGLLKGLVPRLENKTLPVYSVNQFFFLKFNIKKNWLNKKKVMVLIEKTKMPVIKLT